MEGIQGRRAAHWVGWDPQEVLPPLLEQDSVFWQAEVHEGFGNGFDHGRGSTQVAQSPLWVNVSPQLLLGDPPTVDEWLEVWVNICALLRDVEVAGELVRKVPTRLDDGALEEQLLSVLGAVAEVGGAYVVAEASRGPADAQHIRRVQQDGVEGVDPDPAGNQQQIHRGVRGRRVKEEISTDTHGHAGAHCAHGVDPVCRRVFGVFHSQFNHTLSLQQPGAGAH